MLDLFIAWVLNLVYKIYFTKLILRKNVNIYMKPNKQ